MNDVRGYGHAASMESSQYSVSDIKFFNALQARLAKRHRVLRVGHLDLVLTLRESSLKSHDLTGMVLGFTVLAAITALGVPIIASSIGAVRIEATLAVALLSSFGIATYFYVVTRGARLHLAEAEHAVIQAELDDQRALSGLRGRARREAAATLASYSAPWNPPS